MWHRVVKGIEELIQEVIFTPWARHCCALLTGKVPAESIILSGEHKSHPRVNQINPSVSDSISDAVYKAMQLPKEDRFASAAEFKEALHDPDFSYQNPKTVAKIARLARRRKQNALMAILALVVMAVVFVGGVILYPILFPGSTVSADMLTGLAQTQVSNDATSAALNAALLDAENAATLDVLGGMATAMASTSSSNESTQVAVQGFIDETATQAVIQALTKPANGTKTAMALRTSTGTKMPTGKPTVTATTTPVTAPDLVIDRVELVGGTIGSCVNLPVTYRYRIVVYNQGTGDASNFTVNAFGTMRNISILKAGQSVDITDIVKQSSTIVVDFYDDIKESNENNNLYTGYIPNPTAPATCTPTRTVTATPKPAVAPSAPTFIYPVDGQTVVYGEHYLLKLHSASDYDYSLFTFKQNGTTVFEYYGEDTCSIYADSVDQNRFQPGFTEVIIKTNKDGLWSKETRITINLITPVPSDTPTRTPTRTPTLTPPPPIPPAGPNLLGNAGFEDGGARDFLSWTFSPSNSSCSRAQHENIWPFAHTGARFLSTGRSPEYPNCSSVWQEVGIAPQVGQTYTAGFWLRNGKNANPPTSQNVVIALWGTRGPNPESAGNTVTITDFQWSCHQLWFTPNQSGNTVLKIEIYLDKTWLGDVHADDLYLGYGKVQYCP